MHLLHHYNSGPNQNDMQEAEVVLLSFWFDTDAGDCAFGTIQDSSVSCAEHVRHLLSTDDTR